MTDLTFKQYYCEVCDQNVLRDDLRVIEDVIVCRQCWDDDYIDNGEWDICPKPAE